MAKTSTVLLLGLVFHLVFVWCVFDCYFTSPVVHGMQHFVAGDGEAKRLVLFVADGLRADLLYNLNPFPTISDAPRVVAPYLRNIAEKRGAFGVSHTRVPTESRPGHVALIAGMYEDVSAVTKGWKANPVDFDSVFNQSHRTFSFGSPDILPMFARGADPGRVKMWSYNEEDEDFTKDATELDIWVMDRVQELFKNATNDALLNAELRSTRVVFFLHLLGLDTTGHSYRPHSKEYMENIRVVDDIVKKTERLFSEFFNDEDTSYIFTADHGMSNIGNHGDGNPDSTRTPLIVWGAGVRGPIEDINSLTHDSYSAPWGTTLTSLLRQDVEQADIASLMSTLIGANFPANSVGVLPDIRSDGYLKREGEDGEKKRAQLAYANARSILEQYRVKHDLVANRKLFYKEFGPLESDIYDKQPGEQRIIHLKMLLDARKWDEARLEAANLIQVSFEGLRYVETYDRVMLSLIAFLAYTGWSVFSASTLLLKNNAFPPPASGLKRGISGIAISLLIFSWCCFWLQGEPWTYFLYVIFPIGFWHIVIVRLLEPAKWCLGLYSSDGGWARANDSKSHSLSLYAPPLKTIAGAIVALESMVIAYTHRWIWSVGFVVIGVFWPAFFWPSQVVKQDPYVLVKWSAICLATSVFPLRDVEQSENLLNIVSGALLMIGGGAVCLRGAKSGPQGLSARSSIVIQLAISIMSTAVTVHSVRRLEAKSGLTVVGQVSGWVIFVYSALHPMLVLFRTFSDYSKIATLFMTFVPCFIILSINAEGLFYTALCMNLALWVEVETVVRRAADESELKEKITPETSTTAINQDDDGRSLGQYQPRWDDVRIALFFLFFVQVAFFGTGNVASISSFYLEPVYRLVPIFNPFLMASLLLFKIIAPYVMLSAVFALLNARLGLPPFSLFLIALSLTDVMTMTFFFKVTDTGSWLEIGQSISFFVITSLLLVWSAGICALGEWLMQSANHPSPMKKRQ